MWVSRFLKQKAQRKLNFPSPMSASQPIYAEASLLVGPPSSMQSLAEGKVISAETLQRWKLQAGAEGRT